MRLLPLALGFSLGFGACAPDDLVRSPGHDGWEDTGTPDDSDTPDDTDSLEDSDTDVAEDTDIEPPALPAAPAPAGLSTASIAALSDTIDGLLDGSTATHGALILDLDNGQVVYERDPDLWLKPASNTKLFTTAVALDVLGPDHRAEVVAYTDKGPVDGRVGSDLVIVGEHDGSWSTWLHDNPRTPADRLALEVYRKGVRRVAGRLVVRGDFVWEPYHFGTLDPAAQRNAAASKIREALLARGIILEGSLAVEAEGRPPPGWPTLAIWRGSSLEAVTAPINKVSHNEMADNLARHLGQQLRGDGTYAGSEAEIASWLADQGLDTGRFNLEDGSGLSHGNRVSARLVVGLLKAMDDSPAGPAFVRSLSVGAVDGTLASRMTGPDVAGRFFGKSGTLNGVIATSGVLFHKFDGHRYAIALLANEVVDAGATRALHDRVVAAVAADLRREGTRPSTPIFRLAEPDGGGARLAWDASGTIEVWASPDGRLWSRNAAVLSSRRDERLPARSRTCWRLVAVRGSLRSEPSDVLCADPGAGPAVLVVDGNDRWDVQDENPRRTGHDFVGRVAMAVPEAQVSSADNDALLAGDVDLGGFDLVIWLLGEESTEHETFSAAEQSRVRAYVEGGGALVVSGAEVGWDLGFKGTDADRTFVTEVLGGSYASDDAGTWIMEPAEAAFVTSTPSSFHLPGDLLVLFPDGLRPGPTSRAAFGYDGGTTSAIRREDRPVLWFGFPIEALDDHAERVALLRSTFTAFGLN
jgi:D-alanyl-D-alanine carboxypeptidase